MALTNERKNELIAAFGFTDEQMKAAMRSRGFSGLDEPIVLAEVATNMGFLWSFKLKRWFDKNPIFLDDDQDDFDALLDEVRQEDERK